MSRIEVGGQAVIEGVMMRSPSRFVVACRKQDRSIVVRESPWHSIWERVRFLRWPFLRGAVVLWETLHNGLSALTFSANLQAEEAGDAGKGGRAELSSAGITRAIVSALLLVVAIFIVLPHVATSLLGYRPATIGFHLVDGLIKLGVLVAYVGGISLMPEIRRVYQYHGAEHQAIFTYEAGEPLTVEHARRHPRFHPRCGTSFLLVVILISVLLFALTLHRPLSSVALVDHALKVLIKLPLMLPIAGIGYELIKLAGRRPRHPLVRLLIQPGLWLQRLTTRAPGDDQLEIALTAVRRTVARAEERDPIPAERIEVLQSFDGPVVPLASGGKA